MSKAFKILNKAFGNKMWFICHDLKARGDCTILEGNIKELTKTIPVAGRFGGITLKAVIFNNKLQGSIQISLDKKEMHEHYIDKIAQGLLEFKKQLKELTNDAR